MTTTNFPDGVTNANIETPLGQLMMMDPTLVAAYFNDFYVYTAGDWVVTETDAAATEALTAGFGGLLLITNTAADDDLVSLQKTPAAFAMTSNKKAWFSTRFQVSDATQSDVQMGMVIVDTTPLDATDGIYFLKSDGSASISLISRKNATTGSVTASSVGTLVSATNIKLDWYYDGAGKLYYGVNNVMKGVIDISSYFPDATNLTPTITLQNGEAVAKTMTVDYIFLAVER